MLHPGTEAAPRRTRDKHMRSVRILARIVAATVALLVAGIGVAGVGLLRVDWNAARPCISAQLKDRTGRELAIDGTLDVRPFSLTPRVTARNVTLGNAAWGKPEPLISAEEIDFTVALLDLLRGEVVFPEVALKSPVVLLQRDREGPRVASRSRRAAPAAASLPSWIRKQRIRSGCRLRSVRLRSISRGRFTGLLN